MLSGLSRAARKGTLKLYTLKINPHQLLPCDQRYYKTSEPLEQIIEITFQFSPLTVRLYRLNIFSSMLVMLVLCSSKNPGKPSPLAAGLSVKCILGTS